MTYRCDGEARTPGRRGSVEHLVALSGYLVTTLVMTYPVALSLTGSIPMDHQIKGWYPGDGDPWHMLWAVWYVMGAFATVPPPLFWTDLVFYPIGFDMPFLTGIGAILGPAALLAPLAGLVLTYNLVWILSFVFAGYAMYLFAHSLFQDRLIAFFCGHLYMFSSYRMLHAREHLPMVVASCLVPLFALGLIKAAESPTTRRWVFCALVLAISAGVWWYCTISLLIYLAVFLLLLIRERRLEVLTGFPLRRAAVTLAVLVVAASPFVLPMIVSPAAHDGIVNRPLAESNEFAADLLAFFVPSPTNPLFGKWTAPVYRHFTGNPYEQTVYLGYVGLILSCWGVLRAPKEKTRLFVAAAVTFFVLALGPFLHVHGRYRFALDGESLSVPLPYLLLHYVPFVNGMRVPSRFVELVVFAVAVLAGYGLCAICSRIAMWQWRVALVGVLLAGTALELASAPIPVVSAEVPRIYREIGAMREPFTVLELPLDWRVIKYHHYQTVHGKRLLVGHPVRSREKYSAYPPGLPLIPLLKEPQRLLESGTPGDARRDAERLVAFFDVGYIVLHRRYLGGPVFDALDRFVRDHFPHVARWTDGDVVAYAMRRGGATGALWPDDYTIDFGANREFALLSGWAADERWGETTVQWSSGRESALFLYLTTPTDRVLEMRVRPLDYEQSPPQTITVSVNGSLHERLALTRAWGQYRVRVPASALRAGLNEVTFRYGYTVRPATVLPGSTDDRQLAVAFDYVVVRRAP